MGTLAQDFNKACTSLDVMSITRHCSLVCSRDVQTRILAKENTAVLGQEFA